jgi:HD-GYP domain-containing protein (c-di-GMP phosphodiesterase class II)
MERAATQGSAQSAAAAAAGRGAPATLLVPGDLHALVQQCVPAVGQPVTVERYAKLDAALVARAEEQPVVLLANLADYLALPKRAARVPDSEPVPGRVMLMVSDADWRSVPAQNPRLVDVCDRAIAPAGLAYKIRRCLRDMDFDRVVKSMRAEDDNRRMAVDHLNEIGLALSTEKDLSKLLDMIVTKCRQMTAADGGSLYLVEADPSIPEDPRNYFANKKMRFQVAQNDSRQLPFRSFVVDISKKSIYGYVALTQEHLMFDDVYQLGPDQEYGWGGREFDASTRYRTTSMLTVPMVNYRGETIGVIQLLNRKTDAGIKLEEPDTFPRFIRPFTDHDAGMVRSIASQASIAIQNTQLVNSIRTLFDGFIAASVKAIESRDPTTSGHSQRVATLTVALAEQVDRSDQPKFRELRFSHEQLQEIRYASLLHDFGKIGVREHVLVKAKKLYPEELQRLLDRFELIRTTATLRHARLLNDAYGSQKGKELDSQMQKARVDLEKDMKDIEECLTFIRQCNEPTVLAQGGFERLKDIAKRSFKSLDGAANLFLMENELTSLSVPRGSLTEVDRKEIESHVTHTYKFLTTIPWTSDLRHVPEIAYGHHEKLDGSGYPNRLKEEKIPIQSKMMSVADIYDALTALDRPYKKALPAERALNILLEEAKARHIDSDLLELFIKSEIYKQVNQGG